MKKIMIICVLLLNLLILNSHMNAAIAPTITYYTSLDDMKEGISYLGSNQRIPIELPFDKLDYLISYEITSSSRLSKKRSGYVELMISVIPKKTTEFKLLRINLDINEDNPVFNQPIEVSDESHLYLNYRSTNKNSHLYIEMYFDHDRNIELAKEFALTIITNLNATIEVS